MQQQQLCDTVLANDWHVVARSEDVTSEKPLAVKLLGEDIVLWRVGDQVCAWRDLCIHRGTRLSLGRIENETIICPYHGWTYNAEGRCVRIPAHPEQIPPSKARAKVYRATEKYGWVWVTLGETTQDVPVFEEWDDPSFRKIHCGPYTYKASGPRAVENFLDVAHFPFVHQGYLGDPIDPAINDYTAEITPEGVIARDISVWQPNPDGTGEGKRVHYTYKVPRPLSAYFMKTSTGPRFAMFFTVTPVSEQESIAWAYVAIDHTDQTDEEVREFQNIITLQDIPVVESQRPELLPLDLQAELHLRSDRTSIAYRKWLRQLGLSFGTA
uniref:Chlorophyll a oxygenase n=1 Tax=Thermosporothrix sp. COM3 TaxID=2490863 RepID=A0A455SMX6_9CHLR|nr:chlorophyll a oxygenase [Thermosporothrix sp. COM3]